MTQPTPQKFHSIKGLSDQRRLPRLGKIRLGIKVQGKNGGSYPVETPHFVVPPEIERIFGPTPIALKVLLPLNDRTDIFPQAYKMYSRQGLKCKGNGESATRRWADCSSELRNFVGGTHTPNEIIQIPCPCPFLTSRECGPVGHLLVMLPDVSVSGIYQIDVTSKVSIVEINSAIDLISNLLGKIAMIPLTLKRTPYTTITDGVSRVHYMLQLTYDGKVDEVCAIRDDQRSLPALALPMPTDDPITLTPPPEADAIQDDSDDTLSAAPPCTDLMPSPSSAPIVDSAAQPIDATPISTTGSLRQDAHHPLLAAPDASPTTNGDQSPSPTCHTCDKAISPASARYSMTRFGDTLCFRCQRQPKAQARVAYAHTTIDHPHSSAPPC